MKNIFEAIQANDRKAVESFLKNGVDLTIIDPKSGLTASNLAVELDFDEIADLLLNYEEKIDEKDKILLDDFSQSSVLFDASKSQERFYFLDQMMDDPSIYYEHNILEFKGEFHEEIFKKALFELTQRHESLRTQYRMINEEGVFKQEVLYHVDVPLIITDCKQEKVFDIENLAMRELSFIKEKFDLDKAPLWRVKLLYTPMNTCVVLFVFHHIIIDGYSMSIFFKDLVVLYQGMLNGNAIAQTMPPAFQFRQYCEWEKKWRISEEYQTQLHYWRDRLSSYDSQIELPTDVCSINFAETNQEKGNSLSFLFPEHMHQKLITVSKKLGVTPFTTYLGAYFLLLAKYTQQKDIIVGTPFFNRLLKESESTMGCFINTLPLRCQLENEMSFSTWLKALSVNIQRDLIHGQVPYNDIVKQAAFEKNGTSSAELINVFFIYQLGLDLRVDQKQQSMYGFGSVESKNINHYTPGTTKYPVSMELIQMNKDIHFIFNYRCDMYSQSFIKRFFTHYCNILDAIVHNSDLVISDIEMLTQQEIHQQLVDWNQTERPYSQVTINQLFEEQVEKTPDAVALVYEDQEVTFRTLNTRANQVAAYLRTQGIGSQPDMVVGMGTDRSFEMVIGILAVLKAGGAYVPLDLKHPDERLQYMLAETKIQILLTQGHLAEKWTHLAQQNSQEKSALSIISLDQMDWNDVAYKNNLPAVNKPHHVSYVIYTSGSTGQPKGVMGLHAGMVNRLEWMWNMYPLTSDEVCAHKTSLNFVDAIAEFFFPLLKGIKLHIVSRAISENSMKLGAYLKTHKITRIVLVPSLLRTMLDTGENFSSIKIMVVSGETLSLDLMEKVQKHAPHLTMINLYGSSEVSADATYAEVFSPGEIKGLSIGKPLDNTLAYVLDKDLKLLPVGVAGELYIGGVGLARSYLYRPDLTAERFIEHAFSEGGHLIRLYRTGDLVRYLPDGNIEYIGRTDNQIKIRGFRVELEEIEAQLLQQPYILNAAVIARELSPGNKQLIAYVIVDSATSLDPQDLKIQLGKFLPEYMIPSHIVSLEKMPLNVNGKLDRKSLPVLKDIMLASQDYVPPETETEKRLAMLWAELLHLPVEKIGRTDNFFHLGGHSLLSMNLLSRIKMQWQSEVALKTLFDRPVLSDMAMLIERSGQILSFPALVPKNRPEHIPLSFSQQRLWFIENLLPGKALYHVPLALHLMGNCNIEALSKAYRAVIARHESLRTRFVSIDGQATQVIDSPESAVNLVINNTHTFSRESLKDYLEKSLLQPFNLAEGPLLRGELITSAENGSVLFVVMHHIITDGWSMQCYLKELNQWYQHYAKGVPKPEPLFVQYADYSLWQQSWLQGDVLQQQLNYWKTQFSDIPDTINLPTDYVRPQELTYAGGRVDFSLSESDVSELKRCAQMNNATMFMVILSALQIVLYRYSQQNTVIVGTPIANRTVKETEPLIGFFVNTLALKADFSQPLTVRQFVEQIRETTLGAYAHQDLPFEQLVSYLDVPHQLNVNPLFQVMLAYREQRGKINLGDLAVSSLEEGNYSVAKFDLTLTVQNNGNNFHCSMEYAKDLFYHETIERLTMHLTQVVRCMHSMSDKYVHELPLLTEPEIKQQLITWNQTERSFPKTTIHQLFEAQAEKTPDAIALIYEDQKITYSELNAKANRVAYYLRSQGIGNQPDMLVGLATDRSPEMIIGMLAILKAGGAYVPFDSSYPNERLRYMLNDTGLTLLLTQEYLEKKWLPLKDSDQPLSVVSLDDTIYGSFSTDNLVTKVQPNHLAYVIYTSGSTGKPKGTLVEHEHVIAFCINNSFIDTQKVNRIAALSNYAFDGSIFDIFFALLNGKTTIILKTDIALNPYQLSDELKRTSADTMFLTTALLNNFCQLKDNPLLHLKTVLFGGEKCNEEIIRKFVNQYVEPKLIHVYGPTETIVFSTYFNITRGNCLSTIPIGVPLANKKLYVLDNNKKLLPVGSMGELYIGGAGLARGYLNQEAMTNERFIEHRFNSESPWMRLYRTGDLVRYSVEGHIEYLGRSDHQIKIRGFRVELPEIEAQLLKQPFIQSAIVIVRENRSDEKQLIAYIVHDHYLEDKLEYAQTLKKQLNAFLPDYMIPAHIVVLENMPLNANGKIDRKALPALSDTMLIASNYRLPETNTEKALAEIWAKLLNLSVEHISGNDNFFHLGGNSLLIMRLSADITAQWQCDIAIKDIFKASTLFEMAKLIDSMEKNLSIPQLTVQVRPNYIPLSFSQQRLWFLEQLLPGKALYQVPLVLKLTGQCNINALVYAYREIIVRHESLRTHFESIEGKAIQVIDEPQTIPDLNVFERDNTPSDLKSYIEAAIVKPFDLSQGPLIRGELIVGTGEYLFLVVMHHIITDGWSIQCYLNELNQLYQHYHQGGAKPVPLSVQYIDYTLWQQSWLQGDILEKQLSYWKTQLMDIPEVIALHTDYPRPKELTYVGERFNFYLSEMEMLELKNCAKINNTTLFMVMLSVLQVVLYRYSQQDIVVVGTPIANRKVKELQPLIGFFANTLALKADFSKPLTVRQFLEQVKKTTLDAYTHQDVPFEQLVNYLNVPREININPLFQVMFTYQEQHEKWVLGDLHVSSLEEGSYPIAKFDLMLNVEQDLNGFRCSFEYSKDLFMHQTIERLAEHFKQIANHMMPMLEHSVHDLPLLTEPEMKQQLIAWNQTESFYPQTTIHQLFEAQVDKTPDAIALMYEDQKLTYQALNTKANRVAHYLRSQGIGNQPDMLVGVGMASSFEIIVAILAILKVGAAYVPFAEKIPEARLLHMINDTQITVLLTQEKLMSRWKLLNNQNKLSIVPVDNEAFYIEYSEENLPSVTQSNHLAYVMYTSGSTGQPKGVMIEHRGVVSLVKNVRYVDIRPTDRFLQLSDIAFDAATFEIWGALLNGGQLHIVSNSLDFMADLSRFQQYVEHNKVSILWLTKSLFDYLYLQEPTLFRSLRYLLIGGEALNKQLVQQLIASPDKPACLINGYGPTENTTFSCVYDITIENNLSKSVPIGKPISNRTCYVLDNHQQLLPFGTFGELYVGGVGLARGYLNQEELTAEKFIWHQFEKSCKPVRLYRTGDLVHYLPHGNLEYLGRVDNQIKIRGFRVELEEIEAQLLQLSVIQMAVVIVSSNATNKQLIAYIVPSNKTEVLDITLLKKQLSVFLPDYMIPTHIVSLEKIPLNANGKIDRKALPVFDETNLIGTNYSMPRTDVEKALAEIWATLLDLPVENVGITDNFFERGGNSLLAMQFIFQVKKKHALDVAIAQFYQTPTIEKIAYCLQQSIVSTIDPCIIPFSVQSNNKPPIFLIHDGSLFATHYRKLLPSLANAFSVYAVNYPNLMDGDIISYASFEALAADYIQKIKTVFPQGPYRLGGWSMGGNISLEITRQLQAAGEKVELLLFLDTGYQVYREIMEYSYFEIFMLELIKELDSDFAAQSNFVPRILKISYDVYQLFEQYKAKKIEAVDKVLLIKCQGSLVNLANQQVANVDWSYSDLLNGLNYHLSSKQAVHVGDILCHHFELLDDAQQDTLNRLITLLLSEDYDHSYQIGNHSQNIRVAQQKEAIYQLQRLQAETENIFKSIEYKRDRYVNLNNHDLESGYSSVPIDQLALNTMSDIRRNYTLNINQLLGSASYNHYFTKHILTLLGELSPTYVINYTLNLTQKLLTLRFISSESTNLIAALVLDDTLLSMMLLIAQQLNTPLTNYFNVALSKDNRLKTGNAFDAALWLGLTMTIPMVIYGSLSSQLAQAIGMEQDVIDEWRPLAYIHMLASIPLLVTITIETFYQTIYQRQMPALGSAMDLVSSLLSILMFKNFGSLNGLNLGLSLCIGSFCKSFFYLQDIYRKGYLEKHALFQSVPWKLMRQYVKDIQKLTTSSLFTFSNFVVLAGLIASKNGALNLTGYAVARSSLDVMSLPVMILATTSIILTGRFMGSHQFKNALATSCIAIGAALFLAGAFGIVLGSISAKQLTELFINTSSIPFFIQDQFFSKVKESANYFIGLGLVNALRTPLSNYLGQSFAYDALQKITFFCSFVLANTAILVTFFSFSSETKNLIRVTLAASILTTLLMLYQWLRLSDFQCHSKSVDVDSPKDSDFKSKNNFFIGREEQAGKMYTSVPIVDSASESKAVL